MHKTTALLLLVAPALAHADVPTCTPSRLLIVLDKSSSMLESVDSSGMSKWSIAKSAITEVANTYENQIDLGINIFPNPSQCAPGKTLVAPGPGNAANILAAFGADPPSGGNYTPMSQSIDAAAADPTLADPARRPSLLLVTDGWQWCSPYDASTRTWPVDAVQRAKAAGVTVYVVGFGGSVDVSTMNQMAVQAGTAIAGCDPTGTDASSPNKCYYQADSAASLLAALQAITVVVSAEVCDGIDNNCDGRIDEGLSRDCSSACGNGTETCVMGSWQGCTAPSPSPEVCDGHDNDCNGQVDDGLVCGECVPGALQDCSVDVGACVGVPGRQTCQPDGSWGDCVNALFAGQAETCNGLDDDCDGQIDNGPDSQLCPDGGECVDGACKTGTAPAKPSQPDGCACDLGAGNDAGGNGAALLLLVSAAALMIARRRRIV